MTQREEVGWGVAKTQTGREGVGMKGCSGQNVLITASQRHSGVSHAFCFGRRTVSPPAWIKKGQCTVDGTDWNYLLTRCEKMNKNIILLQEMKARTREPLETSMLLNESDDVMKDAV